MQYRVIPFTAQVSQKDSNAVVAKQLESLINAGAAEGWQFLRMETVETNVAPSSGCFGIGGNAGFKVFVRLLIFQRP